MPVMNGHEATRAIRKIESGRRNSVDSPVIPPPGTPIKIAPPKVVQARAKIFALTGLATADDKREAFGSGVDGYLVKPVSLKSLGLIFQSKIPTVPCVANRLLINRNRFPSGYAKLGLVDIKQNAEKGVVSNINIKTHRYIRRNPHRCTTTIQ